MFPIKTARFIFGEKQKKMLKIKTDLHTRRTLRFNTANRGYVLAKGLFRSEARAGRAVGSIHADRLVIVFHM
jgi:hypothetical protein